MNKQPVFLDLTKIHLPITALVSILHRITGILLVALLPIGVAMLYGVFIRPELFQECVLMSKYFPMAFVCFYLYHVVAGTRHILSELLHWHELKCARQTAWFVLVAWSLLSLLFILRVL